MHPSLIEIGPLHIRWYGVMMALGFLAGLASWSLVGRKDGRNFNFHSDMMFWLIVSGLVGARLAFVFANIRGFIDDPLELIRLDHGGLVFYGGLIGGTAGLFLFARRRGENFWSLADLVVTSLPLAHAFGRIGCFLNGCCYGKIHHGLFSVTYPGPSHALPEGSDVWRDQFLAGAIDRVSERSLPVHPVQLYEAAFNLLLYGLLVLVYLRGNREKRICRLYFLAYPIGRFFLETLRGDYRIMMFGLSIAQVTSIGLFAFGLGLLLYSRAQDKADGK